MIILNCSSMCLTLRCLCRIHSPLFPWPQSHWRGFFKNQGLPLLSLRTPHMWRTWNDFWSHANYGGHYGIRCDGIFYSWWLFLSSAMVSIVILCTVWLQQLSMISAVHVTSYNDWMSPKKNTMQQALPRLRSHPSNQQSPLAWIPCLSNPLSRWSGMLGYL